LALRRIVCRQCIADAEINHRAVGERDRAHVTSCAL
jgi:hypothetical protein